MQSSAIPGRLLSSVVEDAPFALVARIRLLLGERVSSPRQHCTSSKIHTERGVFLVGETCSVLLIFGEMPSKADLNGCSDFKISRYTMSDARVP